MGILLPTTPVAAANLSLLALRLLPAAELAPAILASSTKEPSASGTRSTRAPTVASVGAFNTLTSAEIPGPARVAFSPRLLTTWFGPLSAITCLSPPWTKARQLRPAPPLGTKQRAAPHRAALSVSAPLQRRPQRPITRRFIPRRLAYASRR